MQFFRLKHDRDRVALRWALVLLVLPALVVMGFGPGTRPVVTPNPAVVSVVITPNRLQMPDSVVAGDITFEVTNRDSVTHGLALRKDGVDAPVGSLDTPVQPGASTQARLTLEPGTYHVYCPNAVERGLIHAVRVIPEPAKSPSQH